MGCILWVEVRMTTITVKVPEDLLARLAPIAESFNVTIEELVRLSIEDLLSRHDASFHGGTARILDEIGELDPQQG
jgi:predicted transcriptional regulator